MATATARAEQERRQLTRRQLLRALVASTVGSSIEWYDFLLYSSAASIYFGKLFFPSADPLAGTLAAFGTFFVGYAVRPIGALIFGHFGDRVGRKAALIATLLLMGLASSLIGLVPTYGQIGVWGAVFLTILRICQGLGISGEYSGAVLLTVEWGSQRRRGFLASWPVLGIGLGGLLGFVALQVSTSALGADSYWGWRVPFLVSIVLVVVGLYIRLSVLETPVFVRLLEERKTERVPALSMLRHSTRQVVLIPLVLMGLTGWLILVQTFGLTFATQLRHLPPPTAFGLLGLSSIITVPLLLLSGYLSDVIGRRAMYAIGGVALMLFAYPYWSMLASGDQRLMMLAILLSFPVGGLMLAAQGALVAEAFSARYRYSGSGFSYHAGGILGGGTAPIVAVALFEAYHSVTPIAIYTIAATALGLIALRFLRDRSRHDLGVEYDEPPVRRAAVRPEPTR